MANHTDSSYCGLYCGACDVMHLYNKSREQNRDARWEELPARMQAHLPVTKGTPIVCRGCKSDVVFGGCAKCPIRGCARKKDVEHCTLCEKYPCLRFKIMKLVWSVGGFYRKLPHLLDMFGNMKKIQQNGLNHWLAHQRQEWKCPGCKENLTWYTKDDHRCSS